MHRLIQRLRYWTGHRRAERELAEEMELHRAMRQKELKRSGMPDTEAAQASRRAMGNVAVAREDARAIWIWPWLEHLMQDLRYACRVLTRSPGFAIAIVLTLALAIGANTTMFGTLNTLLLRPLPYPEPERLVRVAERSGDSQGLGIFPYDFFWLREQASSFEQIAAYRTVSVNFMGGEAVQYSGQRVSRGMFRLLGVEPMIGRDFSDDEHVVGNAPTIILSHGLWLNRFGASPDVIGRSIRLGGFLDGPGVVPEQVQATVVGVMPEGFEFPVSPERQDFWLPYELEASVLVIGTVVSQVVARLRPGVSIEEAESELDLLTTRLASYYPDWNPGRVFRLQPLREDRLNVDYARVLWVLLGSVILVLLIAITNIGGLFLVGAVRRSDEFKMRLRLGATPWRLARQLVTESLLLAFVGCGVGFGLAFATTRIVPRLLPPDMPRVAVIPVDGTVLGFTLLVSLGAAVLFALAPLLGMRFAVVSAHSFNRARGFLVAFELGVAVVLLVGAGLLTRSLWEITNVDLGFDSENVLAVHVNRIHLITADPTEHGRFYTQVIERAANIRGVEAAAVVFPDIPGRGANSNFVRRDLDSEWARVSFRDVSDDYFDVLSMPLLRGRVFNDENAMRAPRVTIINEALARMLWPGQNPVGQRLYSRRGSADGHTVIGVVGNAREGGRLSDFEPEMYWSYLQRGRAMDLLVRTSPGQADVANELQSEIQSIHADVPIERPAPLTSRLDAELISPRFRSVVVGAFALVALMLAQAGIYGIVAMFVAERRQEFGIRSALGAHPRDLAGIVLSRAMTTMLFGVIPGLAVAYGLTRVLQAMVFRIAPTDISTYAAVVVLILLSGLVACGVPMRRAMKTEPMTALRHE